MPERKAKRLLFWMQPEGPKAVSAAFQQRLCHPKGIPDQIPIQKV
jgi:hypothetical protein